MGDCEWAHGGPGSVETTLQVQEGAMKIQHATYFSGLCFGAFGKMFWLILNITQQFVPLNQEQSLISYIFACGKLTMFFFFYSISV